MKKTLTITLSVIAASVSTINPAQAAYNDTETLAQIYCNQIQRPSVVQPKYIGSRNTMDVWWCAEASRFDNNTVLPGTYAIVACSYNGCDLLEWREYR
jgi:hypothetical protein